MDDFVSGIDNLEFPDRFAEKYQKDESLPLALRQDVTVALIDDGVDLMHKAISGNIGTGRSFGNAFEDQDLSGAPQSFHASATGHGTCMAQMITRICPKVKIFVCKLDFIRQHAGKPSFTAKSAAEVRPYEPRFYYLSMLTKYQGCRTCDTTKVRYNLDIMDDISRQEQQR